MKKFQKPIAWCLIYVFLVSTTAAKAEAIDDKLTNISPNHVLGGGEYIHGQGYGKIMVRVLMFGAVAQQGVHYMPEGTDLVFALLFTGGYKEEAKMNGITVRRKGVKQLIQIDLEDLLADGGTVPKIQDGDVITVPYNWRKDMDTVIGVTSFVTSMASFMISLVTFITLTNGNSVQSGVKPITTGN